MMVFVYAKSVFPHFHFAVTKFAKFVEETLKGMAIYVWPARIANLSIFLVLVQFSTMKEALKI